MTLKYHALPLPVIYADISVAIFQLDLGDLSVVINSVLTSRSPIAGDAVVRSGFRETEMGISNLRTAKWRTVKCEIGCELGL